MRGGIHSGLLVLVNAEHPIRGAERPVLAPALPGSEVLLDARAAAMLTGLVSRLRAAGEIVPVSGWRSMREQQEIWDSSLRENGEDFTRKYVALPGCSEHQTGLAIDLALRAEEIDFIRPTLIVAPITSKSGKKPSQPTHYYAERIHGLELPGMVLLEQIKTIDKRDRKSTRLNSSHSGESRMPSSA